MKCPTCQGEQHRVLRTIEQPSAIERTRECIACGFRWKTSEVPRATIDLANEVTAAGFHFADLLRKMGVGGE